jgi:RecA/RadA recombinase
VRTGMITDIYGESGSGKSQLCFTLVANCVKDGDKVMFIDTAGTFRPERIVEISGSPGALDRIAYVRALTTLDQVNAIRKINDIDPRLLVIDSVTSLFSAEYPGPARHLAVMKHLHELALAAINIGCAVVVTNMVRSAPITVDDQEGRTMGHTWAATQHSEYLGSSVSIYSHIKLRLNILDPTKSSFQAVLVQPPGKKPAAYRIAAGGISDIA